jgi:hypothetical protein
MAPFPTLPLSMMRASITRVFVLVPISHLVPNLRLDHRTQNVTLTNIYSQPQEWRPNPLS